VQRWVAGHKSLDSIEIVGVNRLLELPDFLDRFDVRFELRPARKPIETCDLELRFGERAYASRFQQVLGLVLEMPEIGSVRKRSDFFFGISHNNLLSLSAHCPHIGLKEGS
jgi:hypothetical protein